MMKTRSMTKVSAVCAFALMSAMQVSALVACGNKNKDDAAEEEDTASTASTANTAKGSTGAATSGGGTAMGSSGSGEAPKPTGSTADTNSTAPKAAIEPHVKAELDNKPDGTTGGALVLAKDAKASIMVPTAWKQEAKGDVSTALAGDGKSGVAASAYDGSNPKLDAAAAAIGLTGCTWGTIENVTAGKDKLAANAADGVCTRNGAQVHTAYLADLTDNFVTVGFWETDMKSVFDNMRSITKVVVGDSNALKPCCDAIKGNMASAPPQQKLIYAAAAAACDAASKNGQGIAAVRGALGALNVAGCK
jgi:hypothetical protein